MILVATSIWIDHLHRDDPRLRMLLEEDRAGCHSLVLEELALGSMAQRDTVLAALGDLMRPAEVSHGEVRAFVDAHRLWGRGLGAVDVRLLASCVITPGARLWTRDKRLHAAAEELGIAHAV